MSAGLAASAGPAPFHVMSKPVGPRCNINCDYCYYLEKEQLYPTEKKFRMSDTVLERYVSELISSSVEAGQREVVFAWQGGEPTMLGVDFFRKAVALQKRERPDGVTISNAIQTNGMLLDDDWGAFLAAEGFLVGISIDGPKRIHDRYRRDKAGRATFDAVMAGLEILHRHKVEFNILATVHRGNGGRGVEVYRFLRGLGSPFIQFIPIVERSTAAGSLAGTPTGEDGDELPVTEWSVAPRAYGKFLCDVFDAWYRKDVGKIFVQYFETQVGLWMGFPSSLCVFAETCGNGLALEHNGDLYACDHYVYPQYRLGNITKTPMRDLVWSEEAIQFGRDKRDKLTRQCRECKYRFACNGGCPKHRFLTSHHGEPGQNYFCQSYLIFFKHAEQRLRLIGGMSGVSEE